jgi:hypothetical protein
MIIITGPWAILTAIPMNAVGFSGTVGTGWDGEFWVSMTFRSDDGDPFGVMRGPCAVDALRGNGTRHVGSESARRCFNGRMILLFRQGIRSFYLGRAYDPFI